MTAVRAIRLDMRDNVANVLEDVRAGTYIEAACRDDRRRVKAVTDVPFGFKVALVDIPAGELVIKYGETIGRASGDIKAGEMVHIHNMEGTRGRGDLEAKGAAR